jgi:hypothetical protein
VLLQSCQWNLTLFVTFRMSSLFLPSARIIAIASVTPGAGELIVSGPTRELRNEVQRRDLPVLSMEVLR